MNDFVTMSEFGKKGRFGNQLFQYMFLYTYARRHNLELRLPTWVGNYLYGLSEQPADELLIAGRIEETAINPGDNCSPLAAERHPNHDLDGYFQHHTRYYNAEEQAAIRVRLRPIPEIRDRLLPAVKQLLALGTPVGIHIRRCDQGVRFFYRTPTQWYKNWLDVLLSTIEKPILFIASDDPNAWKDFAEYHPVTAEMLGAELTVVPHANYNYLPYEFDQRTFDIFPEFHLLQHCKVLGIGNSTFAFAAAMLNYNQDLKCWRSQLPIGGFGEVDPWNARPLITDVDVKDYPQYPEARMSTEEVLKYHKPLARDIFREWGIA